MIKGINKTYESMKINNSMRKNDVKGKEFKEVDSRVYSYDVDYSFIDLDRLITAVIERYLSGGIGHGFHITYPDFQNEGMDKDDLKFSQEFFDIIEPLVESAYEKKSLGDIEYYKYREYIGKKVTHIAMIANGVVNEFKANANNATYDEQSLRKAADDYFMNELSESDDEDLDAESIVDEIDRIHDTAKFRILNDQESRDIFAELKTLI